MKKEEKAIVLDFLPHGYAIDEKGNAFYNIPRFKKTPIVQAIGVNNFTLLELVPKKDVVLNIHQEIYIGEGIRDQIHHINGKLNPEKLTATARAELEYVVSDLVLKNEKRFVDFINKSQPISTRLHVLELMPGLGKKHMWEIIEQRKEKPFESFQDLKNRIKLIPEPQKVFTKRIISEILGNEKYNFFVGK